MDKTLYLGAARERIDTVMEVLRRRDSMEKILTENASEKLTVKWDRERFAIIHTQKFTPEVGGCMTPILLNPKEMLDLVQFVNKLWKELPE